MPATPFKATGTAPQDTPWSNTTETRTAILGEDGDNWANYIAASAWTDGSTGEDATSHAAPQFLHHRVNDNGQLEAVWHGVTSALARLKQSELPDAELEATFRHLASHYAQWDKTPPKWDRFRAEVQQRRKQAQEREQYPMMSTRAMITVNQDRPNGTPTDADMRLINAQARSPLDVTQVYVFPSQISNQGVDAYFTRMSIVTLGRFAKAASRGVAICDSHNHYQLPIGRSYYGEDADAMVGSASMVVCNALGYMMRGMRLPGGMMSDDIIRGIESGMYQDISVGFIPFHIWCNICDMDMLHWGDCNHWPGQSYETKDRGTVMCSPEVDADLAEYSVVYDGATPNAMILKAERILESGQRITQEQQRNIRLVEDRCRIKLFDRYTGFTMPTNTPASAAARVSIQHTPAEEDTDMPIKGSEFVRSFIAAAVEKRGGKELSAENMQVLRDMCSTLEAGHDTMKEGITAMAAWLDTKGALSSDDPMRASSPKSGSGAKGTSSNKKASDDGTSKKPADEAGNADDAAEDDANTEDGTEDGGDGEDKDDAKAAKTKKRAKQPDPPETDDGDGDDDALPKVTEETDEDDYDGASSEKAGKKRTTLTAAERAFVAIGQRATQEATQAALEACNRAGLDSERYKVVLARSSYDDICQFRDDWSVMARAVLSPIGTFTARANVRGGGTYDDQPTGQGGRQTVASDPNDPSGLQRTVRQPLKVNGRGDNASMYRAAPKAARRTR